jgi:competence protein ComEA
MRWISFLGQLVSDSLAFSRSEARGLLVLLAVVLVVAVVPNLYLSSMSKQEQTLDAEGLAQWKLQIEQSIKLKENEMPKVHSSKILPPPALFDPNYASVELMQACGLSERVARGAVRYRDAGGVFRVKDDIRKLHGITDDMVRKVWGYLDLPEKREYAALENSPRSGFVNKRKIREFELNNATAPDLVQLYGIGEKRAELILKYRDRLGGFVSYDQLLEVYSMTPEVVDTIRAHTSLKYPVKTISLNTDSVKWLTKHPYINNKLGYAIINYRKVHGDFKRVEDVRKIKILSDSIYHKLTPYLSL